MAITDVSFIFFFLPAVIFFYYLANDKAKTYLLLGFSLFFYSCGSGKYFALLLFSLFFNILFGMGLRICRKKKTLSISLLLIGVLYNVSILVYYKYFDFVLWNMNQLFGTEYALRQLVLPLGLSFFTFKAISYLADVYKGKVTETGQVAQIALYLSFFAQIQSGPLSRYGDMYPVSAKNGRRRICYTDLSEGIYRFIIGFNKKILLSNVLDKITQETFSANSSEMSVLFVWLGAVCYSMQLFFDFSGYSDMAIGISRMLGYGCPENFRYPYMTASISEFWRRWHITLGAWFRDYVYIPLGGSRVKNKCRLYFNLFAVWILTGIWHGAKWNFVFWGMGYFVFIAFEKGTGLPDRFKSRFAKIIYRIFSLLIINFQWVIFRANGLRAGLEYIKHMFYCPKNVLADARAMFLLRDYAPFLLVAVLLCFPVIPAIQRLFEKTKMGTLLWNIALAVVNVVLFIWALSYIVAGQNNPFTYANF